MEGWVFVWGFFFWLSVDGGLFVIICWGLLFVFVLDWKWYDVFVWVMFMGWGGSFVVVVVVVVCILMGGV